jgi:hypothetical protein
MNAVAKRRDIAEPAPAVPGGGLPPAAALGMLCEMLSNAIEGEAAYPSRPELHRRLKAIEDAARLLMKELPDRKILALLLNEDAGIENISRRRPSQAHRAPPASAARAERCPFRNRQTEIGQWDRPERSQPPH